MREMCECKNEREKQREREREKQSERERKEITIHICFDVLMKWKSLVIYKGDASVICEQTFHYPKVIMFSNS